MPITEMGVFFGKQEKIGDKAILERAQESLVFEILDISYS